MGYRHETQNQHAMFCPQSINITGQYLTWRYLQAGGQSVHLCPWRFFSPSLTQSLSPCGREAGPWPLQPGTGHTAETTEAHRAVELEKKMGHRKQSLGDKEDRIG